MNTLPPTLRRRASPRASQAGATLIEVLVSFVIFAFGMLGVAGLQTKALALNQASLMRSQAAALTDDVIDRMRADRVNAMAGRWNSSADETASSISDTGPIYNTDRRAWKQAVERLLPEGRARITVAAGVVTIQITWNDSRGADDNAVFETVSRL